MLGIDGYVVRVEADSAPGTPGFALIGLPDRALGEARDRVRAAIVNCGYRFPAGKILVNLAPADIRKVGPGFDLPIALALLAIDEQARYARTAKLRRARRDGARRDASRQRRTAILPMASGASECRHRYAIVVPRANAREAALIDGHDRLRRIDTLARRRLGRARARRRSFAYDPRHRTAHRASRALTHGDFSEVRGQASAKRALEIAAAGGHNVLLIGPPGCGKTMLAQRLPSILPAMTPEEAIEVTKIYSVAGLLGEERGHRRRGPFRAPHHTISTNRALRRRLVRRVRARSRSHTNGRALARRTRRNFRRAALEVMRQPLEDGSITIARAAGTFRIPGTVHARCIDESVSVRIPRYASQRLSL